ncbi:MAG: outer membrane protein assembly factor BamA [Bacteroidales bacterium]|nr:outer membrane protein assembly factor BamA [Bacteroidales bacterium]
MNKLIQTIQITAKKGMKKYFILLLFTGLVLTSYSQNTNDQSPELINYTKQKEYIIAEIKVSGVEYLNPNHLVTISGMSAGQKIKIPGPETSKAIEKFWNYGLFSDVQIIITKTEGDKAWLEIILKEQPRLKELTITGVKKGDQDDIKEKLDLLRGTQITNNVLNNCVTIIKKHYVEKGFLNTEVDIHQRVDTSGRNQVDLVLDIKKNKKVKIEEIIIEGNEAFTDKRLRRTMKKTKQIDLNIFKGSKYIASDYREDKNLLLDFYNQHGYRDASIVNEEFIELNNKRMAIKLTLFEGSQYYIRNIDWIGNTQYPAEYLNAVLGIKVGQLYDKKLMNDRLNLDEDAVSSVYLDNGYLFFTVTPVETRVEGDSVDVELRIYEGKQATINNVLITGNTKTNEHVARREIRTLPGELFSKTLLIRSVRELANLGHFNPETINPNVVPNQAEGTVDLEYMLEERSNDQLELSGGWGGYYGFVGSVRLRFANFAIKDFFDLSAWRPVPSGDGQTLSLGFQTNLYYHSFNVTFVEPWLGGNKPNSLSVSANYTLVKDSYTLSNGYIRMMGASVGFGRRLKWPDDYFSLYTEFGYQQYKIHDYNRFEELTNGNYNLFSLKGAISRSSQDQPIYPRKGSTFNLSVQVTPPYSLFKRDNFEKLTASEIAGILSDEGISASDKQMEIKRKEQAKLYRDIEFHKWKFDAAWYTALIGDLVLATKTEFGFLGFYDKHIGPPPFEKFDVGGSGLSGYSYFPVDVVPLRGYEEGTITPLKIPTNQYNNVIMEGGEINYAASRQEDGNIYTRYYAELRYPVTLNPSATIYGLAFIEAGNAWRDWDSFNPFGVKRSAGVGVRAFLPMFGLLGIDWGYGFDSFDRGTAGHQTQGNAISGSQWHFVIGQQL